MRVKLLAYNHLDGSVKALVMLGFKVSSGRVREKGIDHYLKDHSEDLSGWMIEGVKYPSVLEHVVFTFYIEGISRVTSHQLIRHRLASYTQESQRYSSISKDYVIPETVVKAGLGERFKKFMEDAFKLYEEFVNVGIPYEDARYVLPQAVTTRLIMTLNLRELLHIACLRLSKDAQWEIRELVRNMVTEVSNVLPEINKLVERYCREV
ncbi:MAG: FAD-dependent thymidylate synthase [Sulfolobales archaeon]|nr:FAD-dependent thymidylate synthase [Sulfolobales archaeon]MCX8186243.1 FAD-dependent thymidylate synthase [Sulfolobales archaeon]MDW7969021.1 FAD-dependent thymidylate synthase [Sulfolobales archaeon]